MEDGTDNLQNKTPPPRNKLGRGEMRELRSLEGEATIVVPLVVRILVVGVQPLTIIVPVGVEHVRIAIGNAHCPFQDTAL